MISEERIRDLYETYLNNPTVTTDSRDIAPGSLFFALRGDNFDGNRFALQAIAAGASFAVVDDPKVLEEISNTDDIFLVDNVLEALQALASHHRKQLGLPILAITGTNGKTSTKELIAAVLSRKYTIYATKGNLNNHIGVPLTLLAMTERTQLGIVEMGASAQGEIKLLCDTARPNFGIITNIGRAHLEGFGGEEGIRTAKGELYDWLASNDGTAIVREDDETLHGMALARAGLNIKYYNSLYADGVDSKLTGAYNRLNIAAAVAVGRLFDIEENDIRLAISEYTPTNNRSQTINTGRNIVIADCYNANPSSMRVSIEDFLSDSDTAPKVLILGDMYELGSWSAEEHKRIAELALDGRAAKVLFVGDNFAHAVASIDATHSPHLLFGDTAALADYINTHAIANSRILVKGSRATGLEKMLDKL